MDGEAGLKRYTVVGIVQRLTRRPAVPPVAVPGHDGTPGAYGGGWSTRAHVARVWALHEADAINQVFGTGRAARYEAGNLLGQQFVVASNSTAHEPNGSLNRTGSNGPACPVPPPEPGWNAPRAVIDAAQDAWPRLERRVSTDARVALVVG